MPSDELVIETVSFKQQSQPIYQILAVLDFKFQAFQASQPGATLGNKPISRCKSANFPFLFFCTKKNTGPEQRHGPGHIMEDQISHRLQPDQPRVLWRGNPPVAKPVNESTSGWWK